MGCWRSVCVYVRRSSEGRSSRQFGLWAVDGCCPMKAATPSRCSRHWSVSCLDDWWSTRAWLKCSSMERSCTCPSPPVGARRPPNVRWTPGEPDRELFDTAAFLQRVRDDERKKSVKTKNTESKKKLIRKIQLTQGLNQTNILMVLRL